MASVEVENKDGVAVIRLNSGRKNPINPDLVRDLSEMIGEIERDSKIHSMVLTSSDDRFFSIGLDVPRLINLERSEFREFIKEFNLLCLDIYTLPKPTIASINGHAIAGGCILTLCCDFRYAGDGRILIGLNEVKLGVSVPYLPQKILEQIAGERVATEMIYGGEFYSPEKALEMGIVDGVFSSEELLQKSFEKAKVIGGQPAKAFTAVKMNRTGEIKELALKKLERDVDVFVELWFSEVAQKRLKEAAKNF